MRTGDFDAAESTVLRWWPTVASSAGQRPSMEGWLSQFPRHELMARPYLMINMAWVNFATGEPHAALDWLRRAAEGLPERHPPEVQGFLAPVALATARAIIEPLSLQEMADEARYAYERVGLGDGHPLSCLAQGAAAHLGGDEAAAVRWLREGVATPLDRPLVIANCLALLASIDVQHGRWGAARQIVMRALALIGGATFSHTVLVRAIHVLVETREGRAGDVEDERARCRRDLVDLQNAAPWMTFQAHLSLGRAALLRGERMEAEALARDAGAILAGIGGARGGASQLAALTGALGRPLLTPTSIGPSSLSNAELRVLSYLPTHLSIGDIAERLFVSRNTVKSQSVAIYRKLGCSTRASAVQIARAFGLIDETIPAT
jgi:LuxR family maltose regulon positive regulatory protein